MARRREASGETLVEPLCEPSELNQNGNWQLGIGIGNISTLDSTREISNHPAHDAMAGRHCYISVYGDDDASAAVAAEEAVVVAEAEAGEVADDANHDALELEVQTSMQDQSDCLPTTQGQSEAPAAKP